MAGQFNKQGQALQATFVARGIECTPEESARLARFFLSLAERGVLVPAEKSAAVHQDGTSPGICKSPGSRPVGRRAPALETAHAYNIGQSVCMDGE